MITNFNNTQAKPISFSALKEVKYSGTFNPQNSKEDFASFNGIFLSDTFRHLIKNYDVKLKFDKFHREDNNTTYTILHYEYTPIPDKKELFTKKLSNAIKHSLFGNPKTKKGWMEAYFNKTTGEKTSLIDKILNFTIKDLEI